MEIVKVKRLSPGRCSTRVEKNSPKGSRLILTEIRCTLKIDISVSSLNEMRQLDKVCPFKVCVNWIVKL
jgi:hypothetical protein